MTQPDEKTIQELQNPETQRKAFAVLVEMYSKPLYNQIRKMVLSHDDTNDLLQNTFLKAWDNLEYFRGDAQLSTWLYRIAVNESLSFLNKQRQQKNISIDNDDSFLADQLESDPYFDGDETQMQLQKAILTLPEKQRLVFNMRYFDEMKYEEISQIVGTTVGALKASYHHAMLKIEKYFNALD